MTDPHDHSRVWRGRHWASYVAVVALAMVATVSTASAGGADAERAAQEAFVIEQAALATEDLEVRANSADLYRSAIDLFTAAIACPVSETTRMAALHSGRGLLRHLLGDDEAAVQDYSRAIEIEPGDDVFYERRAISQIFLGNYAAAVNDFDQAIARDRRQLMPYTGRRAFAQFYSGNFAAAESGFAEAISLGDPRVYIPIWRHISAGRSDGDVAALALFSDYDRNQWPGVVVDLLKGDATVDDVLAQTRSGDPVLERNLRTEALFYIGQYHLLQDRPADAKVAFQQILKLGDRFFAEYVGAVAELARLAPRR